MKRTIVFFACALGAYCLELGDTFAWSNPFLSVPTQDDVAIVRTPAGDCSANPNGTPDPYTVWVYQDAPYSGACKILLPGLYPTAGNFGLGNDSMSAIKIGSGVRARIFEDVEYKAAWVTVTSSTSYLGDVCCGWNDTVSSMRVELSNRASNCADVGDREMAVFRDANYQNDCMVLPVMDYLRNPKTYNNPAQMGIPNDSISSIKYRGSYPAMTRFYWDVNLGNGSSSFCLGSAQDIPSLPSRYGIIIGPNDQISSIGPYYDRNTCSGP